MNGRVGAWVGGRAGVDGKDNFRGGGAKQKMIKSGGNQKGRNRPRPTCDPRVFGGSLCFVNLFDDTKIRGEGLAESHYLQWLCL